MKMICCMVFMIQSKTIVIEKGYGGPLPLPKKIIELLQNPALSHNSSGYTSLIIMSQ